MDVSRDFSDKLEESKKCEIISKVFGMKKHFVEAKLIRENEIQVENRKSANEIIAEMDFYYL